MLSPLGQKLQTYRLTVTIHEINISVKFPCSVTIALKADSKDTEIHKDYKLLNGNAKIEENCMLDLKLIYNGRTKMYTETKVCVLVYLKSSSGRIPAGSATILVKSDREHGVTRIGIEKCPDKTANIEYSLKMVKVKEEDYLQEGNHSKSTINLLDPSHMPITTDIRQSDPSQSQSVKKYLKSQMFSSRISSAAKNNLAVEERERSDVGSQQSQSQSRISKMIMKEHENQVNSQRQKILELQKEKIKAMKEIRALRHEVETNSLKNSAVSEFQDQNLLMRHEVKIQNLENQLEKQKNKASQYQNQSHKRKLKIQELEKDIKIIQKKYETLEEQIKKQVTQKEQLGTKNKQLAHQLRELKQKYQDQLLMHENYVKRAEFKENVYKEQLKNINDKYTASESEKQKLLFQKSQIISQTEQRDKKQKDNYRARQRTIIEQKNKLLRKIDSFEKQLTTRQEQKAQFEARISELEAAERKNRGLFEGKEAQIEELERRVEEARLGLEKEITVRRGLEADLVRNDKLDEQRKNFKKLLAEKDQQIAQITKTKANLETTKRSLSQKLEQLQKQLRQCNGALKVIQKQYENLTKKYETLKKSQQQKAKQLNDITFIKQSQQTKVYGLSQQLKQLQKRNKTKELQTTKFIQNLNNRISELEQQNQQLSEKCYGMNQQLHEMGKNLEEVKNAYQIKLGEMDKIEGELSECYMNQEKLSLELQELEMKKAQTEEASQGNTTKLTKKIKQLQSQLKQSLHRHNQASKTYQQSLSKLTTQLKSYQLDTKGKDKQLYQLKRLAQENEAQIAALTSEIEQTTIQVRNRSREVQGLKEVNEEMREEIGELEEKLREIEFELETSKNENKILEQTISANGRQKQQSMTQLKKSKKQLQKFKSNNQYFLKTFFTLMTQPDIPQVINITHDDPQIVKSMMEVLKKKKAVKVQYDTNLGELNDFNEALRGEIQGLKGEVRDKEEVIRGLNKEVERIAKQKDTSEKAAEKLKLALQAKIAQQQKQIQNLQKDITDLQSGGTNLSSIIKQKQQQIATLNIQLTKTKKSLSQIQQQLSTTISHNNEQIKIILNNTNLSISQLKAQLQILKIKCEAEETKRKMVSLTNQQYVGELEMIRGELGESQRRKGVLEGDIGRLKEEIKQHLQTIRQKDNTLAQIQANHNSVASELQFSNNEYRQLTQKVINLQIVNKGQHQKIEKLEGKIREQGEMMREKERELEEEARKGDGEVKKLGKQMENQRKVKANLEAKIKQLEAKITQTEGKNTQANKQLDNLRKKINILSNQTIGQRQKYTKQQQSTIKRYELSIQEKDKQIQILRTELEETRGERDFLQSNITNLQRALEQAQQQNRRVSEQSNKKITSLQKQNQGQTQQLSSVKQQLKQLQTNLTELSRSFQSYQLQNNTQIQYLQPIATKLSRLLSNTDQYLKFMSQFQASKSKLIKIGNYKLENYGYRNVGEIVREINAAAQRCKLGIINKAKIPQEDKTAIVEEFKTLQMCIEKVSRF